MRACLALIIASVLVLSGCRGRQASPTETATPPEFRLNATIKDIMDSLIDPAADYIWDAVATTVTACGGGSESAAEAATDDGVAESVQIDVKPCELLKPEEISEQLFLAVQATERQTWTSPDFELSTTEPDIGLHKRCEYKFASRQQVGGGPVWHSDFEVMVLPANVVPLPEEDRKPIDSAGIFSRGNGIR